MASCSSGDELTDDGSYGASCLVVKSRPTQLTSDDDRSGSSSDSDSEDSERDGGERRSSGSSSDSEDGELAGASMTAASAARQRAQAGSPAAQYELGKRYSDGDGVCSDDAEAVRWFRRAAAPLRHGRFPRHVPVAFGGRAARHGLRRAGAAVAERGVRRGAPAVGGPLRPQRVDVRGLLRRRGLGLVHFANNNFQSRRCARRRHGIK